MLADDVLFVIGDQAAFIRACPPEEDLGAQLEQAFNNVEPNVAGVP